MKIEIPKGSCIEESEVPKVKSPGAFEAWRKRMARAKLELALHKMVVKQTKKVARSTTRLLSNECISNAVL